MFFLGGQGGKRKHQGMVSRVGHWTTRVFKQTHFVISYVVRCSDFDNPSTCSTHEDGEGVATPRSVTDSTEQWV
jgi:hypothetical protein